MQRIEHIELGSAAANITFSSIPQTYTDLLIKFSIRSNRTPNTEDSVLVRFNGVTTGYTTRALFAAGSVFTATDTASTGITRIFAATAAQTSSTFSNSEVYIPNYTSATAKSVSGDSANETNGTDAWKSIAAGLWDNTAAISTIALIPNVGTQFEAGSSATLFGIKSGSDGTTTVS